MIYVDRAVPILDRVVVESTKLAVVKAHHSLPWLSSDFWDLVSAGENIQRVDMTLDLSGLWPGLRLDEYQRDEKLARDARNRTVTDVETLKRVFRQDSKDQCIFMPRLARHVHGSARRVRQFLDPELVKFWIQQCKTGHSLCSQPYRDSYPVSLTLIDTQDLRLVNMHLGTQLPYLVLSYV